jgi:hypothetical protein
MLAARLRRTELGRATFPLKRCLPKPQSPRWWVRVQNSRDGATFGRGTSNCYPLCIQGINFARDGMEVSRDSWEGSDCPCDTRPSTYSMPPLFVGLYSAKIGSAWWLCTQTGTRGKKVERAQMF